MIRQLAIRGVIVPSDFDDDWSQSMIERGVITPESFFRRNLDAITDDDVDVAINSPGGSVFAAYEMVNAAKDWQARTGKTMTVTVGAMAASAASLFAIVVGRNAIRAHANSKFMFHGATVVVWGGQEALEDEAALLEKINSEIKSALVAQYDLQPETVAQWFAEGRQGWLTAKEAQDVGMVSEIVDEAAEPLKFDSTDISVLGDRGLSIAAMFDAMDTTEDTERMENTEDIEENEETEETTEEEESTNDGRDDTGTPAGTGDEATDGVPAAPGGNGADAAYEEGFSAGKIEGIKEGNANLRTQRDAAAGELNQSEAAMIKAQASITELTEALATAKQEAEASREEVTTELAEARAEFAALEAKHARLTGGNHAPPLEDTGAETWAAALQACDGDYAEARRKYPVQFAQQRQADAETRTDHR